jgi:hypothetical protein
VVALASAVNDVNYAATGWTPQRLGISGLDKDALLAFLDSGKRS